MNRKILLVEDHALMRECLSLLMTQRLPGVAWREAGTFNQALQVLTAEPDIDLVLLDLDLPDSRGMSTLVRWRQLSPRVPVVVLSASDDEAHVLAAIDHGAAGFMPKTVDSQQLARGLERVVAGEVVVPLLADVRGVAEPVGAAVALALSDRQLDVLRLLVEGRSNKDIGRELALSESTVKTHLQAVFRKLDVTSRTQAVLAVARLGLDLQA